MINKEYEIKIHKAIVPLRFCYTQFACEDSEGEKSVGRFESSGDNEDFQSRCSRVYF